VEIRKRDIAETTIPGGKKRNRSKRPVEGESRSRVNTPKEAIEYIHKIRRGPKNQGNLGATVDVETRRMEP